MHGRHNLYLHSRLPELHNSHSFCAFPVASQPRESVLHKPLGKQLARDRLLRLNHRGCTRRLTQRNMLTIKASERGNWIHSRHISQYLGNGHVPMYRLLAIR